jgi:hypothetical protein
MREGARSLPRPAGAGLYQGFSRVPFGREPAKGRTRRADCIREHSPKDGGPEIELIRLRVEKLEGFSVKPSDRLTAIHGRLKSGRLSDGDRAYLANLTLMFERKRHRWALANLQTVYAYAVWLERFLEEEPHEFVAGALSNLRRKQTLTPSQLVALNKFLSNRRGFPKLDPHAFTKYR